MIQTSLEVPLIPVSLGVIAVVVVVICYYWFIHRPTARIERLIGRVHFRIDKFRKHTKPSTFDYYDQKWVKIVFVGLGVLGCAAVPAVLGIPPPYNILTTIMALIVACFVSIYYRERLNNMEQARNINKDYGSMITHYPGEGDVDELWRMMDFDSEVKTGPKEKDAIVAQIVEGVKELNSYSKAKKEYDEERAKKEKDEEELPEFDEYIRKSWRSRLDKFYTYRYNIKGGYSILYVTPNAHSEMKTSNTRPMLDETQWVNVNMIPAFNLYCDTTARLFKDLDEKNRPSFIERTMGVFVCIYNIKSRDDDLIKGEHTVLSRVDQLLATHVHLYAQKQDSARQMTKSMRDLEKTNLELEERRFDEHTAANDIVNNINNLFKELNLSNTSTVSIEDKGTIALIFAIGFAVGAVMIYLMLYLGALLIMAGS